MKSPLEKYGRYISPRFFVGKGKQTNLTIFEVLGLEGKMTIWKTTQKVFEKLNGRAPKYKETQKFYTTIFRRFKELEKLGYIEEYGTTMSKGTKTPLYGLSEKGFLTANLISLQVREKWDKIIQHYGESAKPSSLKVISKYLQHGASPSLITIFMVEPFKRLVLSGEINLDFVEKDKFSEICQQLHSNQTLRLFEDVQSILKKGKNAKLPNRLKRLSQRDIHVLKKMFDDPEMREIYCQKLDDLEKLYQQRVVSTREAKRRYLEHFSKSKN